MGSTTDDADHHGNETTQSSLNEDCLPKCSNISVIKVFGDGRCLFRCATIHGIKALQDAARSHCSGLATEKTLLILEENSSDYIRKAVVSALRNEQANLEAETANLPFMLDSSVGKSYASVGQRLEMMARPSEYAGFLECVALSYVTGRQVLLYEENEQKYVLVAKFPSIAGPVAEPIRLLYQMDTTKHDGHFDIIIVKGRSALDYWTVNKDSIAFDIMDHVRGSSDYASIVRRVIEYTSDAMPHRQLDYDSHSSTTQFDGERNTDTSSYTDAPSYDAQR